MNRTPSVGAGHDVRDSRGPRRPGGAAGRPATTCRRRAAPTGRPPRSPGRGSSGARTTSASRPEPVGLRAAGSDDGQGWTTRGGSGFGTDDDAPCLHRPAPTRPGGPADVPTPTACPQFVIAGAPKAGTTALHAALATHPGLYLSPVKEPKYYLTDGAPPPRERQRGPGRRAQRPGVDLARGRTTSRCSTAPRRARSAGESTPFYLYDRDARRADGRRRPGRKVIAVRARPGRPGVLELDAPVGRRARAGARLPDRRPARGARGSTTGWAPFWHYRGAGPVRRAAARPVPARSRGSRCSCSATGSSSTPRAETLDRVSAFLGVADRGSRTRWLRRTSSPTSPTRRGTGCWPRLIRAGAAAGALAPPQVWRRASRPLIAALHAGRAPRPPLPVEVRREVLEPLLPDIELLEELTGESFADWKGDTGRGDFRVPQRRPPPRPHHPTQPEEKPMTVTDELLANNARYAETFAGPLPLPPAKHVAVAGLHGRPARRLRAARPERGRRARHPQRRRRRHRRRDPLAGDQPAAARHHGDRAHPPHRLRDAHLHRRRVPPLDPGGHRDRAAVGRRGVRRPRRRRAASIAADPGSPFIPDKDSVRGFVFDVATGRLREVG